jgi:glycine cleavage system H protein
MSEFLEFTLDKFLFKVATDRFYNSDGVWAKASGERIVLGMSDYLQQRSGDVAFVEVVEVGRRVAAGESFADVETIKADVELTSPVTGSVLEINTAMDFEAEVINQDPYGQGWMVVIAAVDWAADQAALLPAEAYFEHMKMDALKETGLV